MPPYISNLKRSRHPLWTSLPDDILHGIISRLELPQYSVFTITATTFDIELGDTGSVYNDVSNVWNNLNNVFIVFSSSSINTFRLHLPYQMYLSPSCNRIIDSLASQLCRNNIKHVEITCDGSNVIHAGGRLNAPKVFLMHSLASLNLDLGRYGFVWSIPVSINLPNLKKLSLIFVKCAQLGRLINSCPSLEDLFVANKAEGGYVPEDETLLITSKKLKRLFIELHSLSTIIEVVINAPELKHFKFGVSSLIHDEILKQMFDSISHVKSLELDITTPMKLYTTTIFPKLTHLILWFNSPSRFENLVAMLHNCPNLERLVLVVQQIHCSSSFPQDLYVPFEHMKRIELRTYEMRFDQEFLDLTAYLLRSTPVLDKVVLYAERSSGCDIYSISKSQFHRSIIECDKHSSRCQIEFLGAYQS